MTEGPSNDSLSKARESFKYGRFAEAVEFARAATNESQYDAEAYAILGVSLSRLNQQAEAESALRQAITLAPTVAKHQYNLAAHMFAVGDRETARVAAQQALALEPNHGPARDLLARISREAAPFEQETGPPGATPSPFSQYTQEPPLRPAHSIQFIGGLGWAWDVLGWFLFVALAVTRLTLDARTAKYMTGANTQFEIFQGAERAFKDNSSLFMALFVWYGLFCIWWAFDLADRRPPGGLVTAGVVGMLAFFCCPWFGIVLFPVYYFLRSRPSNPPYRQ